MEPPPANETMETPKISHGNRTTTTPTISQGRGTIAEKLIMTSPNNNLNTPESQMLTPSHHRQRRTKNQKYSRRRSFESIDLKNLLPRGSNSDENKINDGSLLTASNSNHSFHMDEALARMQPGASRPRTRSRNGRAKNIRARRKSFDSIDLKDVLPNRKNSDDNEIHEGTRLTSNNSNHSFSRGDNQAGILSPRARGRPRVRNEKFSRRRSFDGNFFMIPDFSEFQNSYEKSTMEEKLGMTSPNNNLSKVELPILSSSRPRSRGAGRRRNRRMSIGAIVCSVPAAQPTEKDVDIKDDDDDKNDLTKKSIEKSGHSRSVVSLPSNSAHSGYSVWTEMTIQSDILLQTATQHETSDHSEASSASCYFSDGEIQNYEPYEPNTSYTIPISGGEESEDDEDDSSASNFNHEARDNGSLKTLESAFTLDDLGSNSTVSTLSEDDDDDEEDSDTNGSNRDDSDKRIQFIFPSRQQQQQQQRPMRSNHSFGRRRRRRQRQQRRRFSNESLQKSIDDFEEITDDEEDEGEIMLHNSILNMPSLPDKVATMKSSFREGGECLVDGEEEDVVEEEVTVGEETIGDDESGEYFEELLNDNPGKTDDSSKRYEIIISDESFDEEIVVEVEEEEITLEEDESDDERLDEKLENSAFINDAKNINNDVDLHACDHDDGENDVELPIVEAKTDYTTDAHSNLPRIDDGFEKFNAGKQIHYNTIPPPHVDENSEQRAEFHDDDNNAAVLKDGLERALDSHCDHTGNLDLSSTVDNTSGCSSDSPGNHKVVAHLDSSTQLECSVDYDERENTPLNGDTNFESVVNRQSDENTDRVPSTIHEKSGVSTTSEDNSNQGDDPPKIGKVSTAINENESEHRMNSPNDGGKNDTPPTLTDGYNSDSISEEDPCAKPISNRDILMGLGT